MMIRRRRWCGRSNTFFKWIDEYEIVKMFGRIRDKEWRMIMREMDMNGLVLKCVWSKEKGNSGLYVCIGKKGVE